ncbi:hypothetical protein [Holdemania massiliensis]|uniref:hypothetical protein n=1 Tax=Holdemania massiliensis TaxID=1468449 RepID=UPI001F05BD7B|nr:hypothetical protein [Holdemania massiliensis]MCH1940024.1 hypothetical protein [Holdemania massiliensis]
MLKSYATFSDYVTNFLGTFIKDEESFDRYCVQASQAIRKRTFGRSDLPQYQSLDELVMCACALCDLLCKEAAEATASGKRITAETVGDHSQSYQLQSKQDRNEEQERMIQTWLGMTGMLYAGIGTVEYGGKL